MALRGTELRHTVPHQRKCPIYKSVKTVQALSNALETFVRCAKQKGYKGPVVKMVVEHYLGGEPPQPVRELGVTGRTLEGIRV